MNFGYAGFSVKKIKKTKKSLLKQLTNLILRDKMISLLLWAYYARLNKDENIV